MKSPDGATVEGDDGETVRRRAHQDEILIEALADGASYSAAAALAPVSTRTVRRRMASPEFAAAVQQRRAQRMGEVTGLLGRLAHRAVATLEECLEADRPSDQIRAAQVVLGQLHRFRDQVDLEERLRELEQATFGQPSEGGLDDE
jgi:hypothetical protein